MYEPQEDSFLLRDVVVDFLSENPVSHGLDMGTGSGILGLAMKPFCDLVVCVDVNQDVVSFVSDLVKDKPGFLVVESDLFSNLGSFKKKFDVIVFNPPYLPREEFEVDDLELTSGESGLDITFRFVSDSRAFLKKSGKLFFVVSSLVDVNSLNDFLFGNGFGFRVVKKESFFFEEIMVYEAWFL